MLARAAQWQIQSMCVNSEINFIIQPVLDLNNCTCIESLTMIPWINKRNKVTENRQQQSYNLQVLSVYLFIYRKVLASGTH